MYDVVYIITDESEYIHKKGYDICHQAWKNWCNLHNKFLFLKKVDKSIEKKPAHWHKYEAFEVLKKKGVECSRLAYVDLDTMPTPDCPDFFHFADNNLLNVVQNYGSLEWVLRTLEVYSHFIVPSQAHNINYTTYFNTGFFLLSSNISHQLKKMAEFYKDNEEKILEVARLYKGGLDQTICNLLVQEFKIPVNFLSYKFNVQDLPRRDIFRTDGVGDEFFWLKYGYIFHFNCFSDHRNFVEKVYNKLWN